MTEMKNKLKGSTCKTKLDNTFDQRSDYYLRKRLLDREVTLRPYDEIVEVDEKAVQTLVDFYLNKDVDNV